MMPGPIKPSSRPSFAELTSNMIAHDMQNTAWGNTRAGRYEAGPDFTGVLAAQYDASGLTEPDEFAG